MGNISTEPRREISPNRLQVDFNLHAGNSRSETSLFDLCKMIKSPPQHRRLLAEYSAEKSNTDSRYPAKAECVGHTGSLPPIRPSSPGIRKRTSPLGSPTSPVSLTPYTSLIDTGRGRFPTSLQPLPDVGSKINRDLNESESDSDSSKLPVYPSLSDDSQSKVVRQDTYTKS